MSLLVALTKALEAARISSTRPASVPSAEEHAAIINQLDVSRLSLCKAINECESLLANKEAELANLREDTRLLEECDPAVEHANELDSTVCGSLVLISYILSHAPDFRVRMQLYKGLGFEPILDNDHQLSKMLVRELIHHPIRFPS
jgi:kinetochore protein Spc24